MSELGDALSMNKQISHLELDLYDNKIGDSGFNDFMLGIKSQIQLKHLKLNVWRNQITKKSSVMIGQCLKYLVNL